MPNRLADETSPYLLQHKDNPVDWYPWGPEALEKAQREDKPILLSVGYSACHWCHVMGHESFEDPATAAVMNEHFVAIKVDREERPDLDEIYMKAVQAFSGGRGGWPMTVFLTPDGTPFFGGTYFPPEPRHGMPSFQQVMEHAARSYRGDPTQLQRVTSEISRYLQASGRLPGAADEVGSDWLERVATAAAAEFDEADAGFGAAPKFPPHGTLAVLLAHHARSGDGESLRMATATLDAMAKGGTYDLLAGGFARYSVDAQWRVPHFEKMLYDNAQLLPLYADAWVLTGKPLYERVVRQTIGWLFDELRNEQGAFCSALDADSEGVEGRFYAFSPDELRQALADTDIPETWPRVCHLLQVTERGSFEHGSSVLRLEQPLEELDDSDRKLLEQALPALRAFRAQRVRPGLDDKVLTSWNALTVSALARCAAIFDEESWYIAAAKAAAFLLEQVTVDGRLMRTWKGGRAHILAYADDHAFLVQALLDLHQAGYDDAWLRDALALAEQTLGLFWDPTEGGLFYAGNDAERLVTRSKNMMGGAEPSANGVMALALARLALLTDRDDLRKHAEHIARCYRPLLEQAPRALGAEALAGAWLSGDTAEVGIVARREDPAAAALVAALRRRFLPFAVSALVQPDAPATELARLPWMAERPAIDDRATAYVCQGFTCQLPVQEPDALLEQLATLGAGAPSEGRRGQGRDHAPDLPGSLDAWLNSTGPLSLELLRGQVVVLDFWTSCCINCMHLLAELSALEQRFADEPVVVVGVHSAKFTAEKERARVRRAIARHDIDHPVVLDPEHTLWQQYAVKAWPTVVVLDAQGRIAWRQSGEVTRDELGAVVQRLLDEAREAGELSGHVLESVASTLEDTELHHPGKVHIFPDAAAQAMGADPFAPDARLYIADTGHHRIVEARLELGPDGWPRAEILRSFGSGQPGLLDGRAPLSRFQQPQGMCRTANRLWVADTGNHALRCVDLDTEQVRTVAGTGQLGRGAPAGQRPPRQTALRSPWDVAVATPQPVATAEDPAADPDVVFIAMAGSHQIWVYLAEQDEVGPFLGSGREDHVDGAPQEAALAQPSGLVVFGRYIFFADAETSSIRAFDLAERKVGTVVGRGLFDFGDVDGEAAQVRLQHPLDLTLVDGILHVADSFNDKIKTIDLQGGRTRTLAGSEGELSEPGGLAPAGDFLVVADTNHHRLVAVHRQTGELRPLRLG